MSSLRGTRRVPFRAVVAAIAVLTAACEQPAPQAPPPPEIPVVEVIQRDVPISVDFVGETRGSVDVPIRARVQGFVEGIHFRQGSAVKAGDLLYTIDPATVPGQAGRGEGSTGRVATTQLAKVEKPTCSGFGRWRK